MRFVATFALLATLAVLSAAQITPPLYNGPISSPVISPVTANSVNLKDNTDYVIQWSSNVQTTLRGLLGFGLFNATRLSALVHVAMHDTIQAYEQEFATFQPNVPAPPAKSNVKAAIIGAAFTMFDFYFGSNFNLIVKANGVALYQIAVLQGQGVKQSKIDSGLAFGVQVATNLLTLRANDGFNNVVPFVPQTGAGFWRPTPPDFTPGEGNTWGAVTPWGLTNPDIETYFPLGGNTYFENSTRYITDFAEVQGKGRDTNNFAISPLQRTGIETYIGVFFSNDFSGTSFPPGQYQSIAQELTTLLPGATERSVAARILALEAMNLANAAIVGWAVKYSAQQWRPVAAILEAGTDAFPETVADPEWQPLLVISPQWPDYLSGHATFGWSSAQLFRLITGTDDFRFSITSEALPETVTTYQHWSDFGMDNALSRIFLGVHFRAAVLDAQVTGEAIANDLFSNNLRPL